MSVCGKTDLKGCFEKKIQHFFRNCGSKNSATQAHDVSVVDCLAHTCLIRVMAEHRIDALKLVCDYAHSSPSATQEDPSVKVPLLDFTGSLTRRVNIGNKGAALLHPHVGNLIAMDFLKSMF